jgi:hypothetical protein
MYIYAGGTQASYTGTLLNQRSLKTKLSMLLTKPLYATN